MKYLGIQETIGEVPDKLCLTIQITGCGHKCSGCHSPELRDGNAGEELALGLILKQLEDSPMIDCVVFLGGQQEEVNLMAEQIKEHANTEVCWYTGDDSFEKGFDELNYLDYIKVGHYDKTKGGLDKRTTNQRMYAILPSGQISDITTKFWKNY